MKDKTREMFNLYLEARLAWMRTHTGLSIVSSEEAKALAAAADEAWASYYEHEKSDETCSLDEYLAGCRAIELRLVQEITAYKDETGEAPEGIE